MSSPEGLQEEGLYEGLNLPDLMALMHDLVLPEPVSWMPQTVGWQILAVWLGVVAGIYLIDGIRRYRRDRYRREAIRLLDQVDISTPTAGFQIASLLKRTALAVYPRRQVASLYGEQWANFLLETSHSDGCIRDNIGPLVKGAYIAETDLCRMQTGARRWIEVHHA